LEHGHSLSNIHKGKKSHENMTVIGWFQDNGSVGNQTVNLQIQGDPLYIQ